LQNLPLKTQSPSKKYAGNKSIQLKKIEIYLDIRLILRTFAAAFMHIRQVTYKINK